MDSTLTAGLLSTAAALAGTAGGWLVTRRSRHANVELTEAQTEDLQTRVYDRVLARQEAENQELLAEVAALKAEVAELRERLRHFEQVQDERDAARAEADQLRQQLAAKQAELDAAYAEIERLRTTVVTQAQTVVPMPPST